jgi:exonuclease III
MSFRNGDKARSGRLRKQKIARRVRSRELKIHRADHPVSDSVQELKAEQRAFPAEAIRALGYQAVWQGERSWNGVGILARGCEPVLTRSSLPGHPDRRARYIEAAVNGVQMAPNLRLYPVADV